MALRIWGANEPEAGTGGGEANTASNLGTGEGLYAQKVGVDLEFKSLKAGTNVTLSSDANTVTISASGTGGGVSNLDGGDASAIFGSTNPVDGGGA